MDVRASSPAGTTAGGSVPVGAVAPAVRPASVPRELEAAVARIRSASGAVVGCGFLVDPMHVVTCAHVVSDALGHPDVEVLGSATIDVEFPLLATSPGARASVVRWDPATADDRGDVAVLRLLDAPPVGLVPARLLGADDLWGHTFRAYGFPRRHDHGVWAAGVLRGRQAAGWIQMEGGPGYAVEPGFSGSAVWDDELAGVVGMTVAADSAADTRASYLIPTAALVSTWPDLAARTLPPCPYRGLHAFREQDADVFHGRSVLVERLLEQVESKPVVAVVGPSGSGKSSVVFAGLLPRLLQRPDWTRVSMRPSQSATPVQALAAALLPSLEPDRSEVERLSLVGQLAEALTDGRLPDVVHRLLERAGTSRLLLVVDQFEEVFAADPERTQEFTTALLDATVERRDTLPRPLTVVLTLRADFLGAALQVPRLAGALSPAVTAVGQMGREQLREIIERPLPPGVRYEEALVDRMLDDIGDEPGSLPLLEFALTLLWERQDRGLLTHAAYRDLGRVQGALASYAERVFLERVPAAGRDDARRLFTQLVRPSDVGPVRRVARRPELGGPLWGLAQDLASTRLLVADRDADGVESVELVHEALITQWARLRDWVAEDREFRVWQEELRDGLERWSDHDRDNGALLRGAQLAEAQRWARQRPQDVSGDERDFISASASARRMSRGALAALLSLLLVAVTAGGVAYRAFDRAAKVTHSRELVDAAFEAADERPDVAMLLAAAAHRAAATSDATRAVTRFAAGQRQVDRLVRTDMQQIDSVAFRAGHPNQVVLAGGGVVAVWDLERGRRAAALEVGFVMDFAVSPTGAVVAIAETTSDNQSRLSLWDLESTAASQSSALPAQSLAPSGTSFSPDGALLGWCDETGVQVWSVSPLERLATIPLRQEAGCGFGFTSGRRIAYVHGRELRTWDLTTGRVVSVRTLPPVQNAALGPVDPSAFQLQVVAVTPDGGHLVLADWSNGSLQWWDTSRHRILGTAATSSTDISFSPGGRWAMLGQGDLEIVEMAQRSVVGGLSLGRTQFEPASGGPATASGAVAIDDAGVIVGAAGGGTLAVSTVSRADDLVLPESFVQAARLTGGDAAVALTLEGERVVLRSRAASTRELLPARPPRAEDDVSVLAPGVISPDGRWAARTGLRTGTVEVVEVSTGRTADHAEHAEQVATMAFDSSSRFLVTADRSTAVVLELETGRVGPDIPLAVGDEPPDVVAVHPDGRTIATAGVAEEVTVLSPGADPRVLALDTAYDLEFSPNGRSLAISTDRGLRMWDVAEQRLLAGRTHDAAYSIGFSADGRHVAGLDNESAAVVWRLPELEPVGEVAANAEDVVFSPTGELVVRRAGRLMVLDLPSPGAAVRRICELRKDLTRQEWSEYAPDLERVAPCG